MARARKSHVSDEEKVKTRKGGIEPARAQTGHNPYVVYADLKRDQDEHARVLILNFAAKYAARYFIMKLIHTDTWEECDPVGSRTGIRTSSGVRITMFNGDLQPLIDYEPTEAEKEWQDEQIDKWVLSFKYGRGEGVKEVETRQGDDELDSAEREGDGNVPSKGRGDKPKREPKPPKPVKVKPDTSGHISANDIAKELKVEGREVRGVLRALKLEKPAHGWSWPKAEAEKIKTQVEKGLKEAKKGKKK